MLFDTEAAGELAAVFAAGSVGPDMGFFPGGPRAFSKRVHRERSGDFLRELTERAGGGREKAFAAGWGLHVYTDLAIHPWVEARVCELLRDGAEPAIADLWHMRLEWGADCRLLAGADGRNLWRPELGFPRRQDGSSLLGEVGADFYGIAAAEAALARGEWATAHWLRLIPKILWWGGHAEVAGRSPHPLAKTLFARMGNKIVGQWLGRWAQFSDPAALASPMLPGDENWQHLQELGQGAVERFYRDWQQGFAHLANFDLNNGRVDDG